MNEFFIYFAKVSALVLLFYLVYRIFLSKETFFNLNRWFLLIGLIISLILPLIVLTETVWVELKHNIFNDSVVEVDYLKEVNSKTTNVNWKFIVLTIYIVGIIFFFTRFVLSSLSLYRILSKSVVTKQDKYKFIDSKHIKAPFSFLNYIVYDSSDFSGNELEYILVHEKIHSDQKHCIDVLFSELFCALFWCNPFVWLYKKELKQNLEFIADDISVLTTNNKKNYQRILLETLVKTHSLSIVNPFSISLIEKRIIMLNKKSSKNVNLLKYLSILPVLIVFILQFQTKVIAQTKKDKPTETEVEPQMVYIGKTTKELAPLIIVNGEEKTNMFFPKYFDVEGANSYQYLDEKEAVKKFGEKGKNGAYIIEGENIIITTRENK